MSILNHEGIKNVLIYSDMIKMFTCISICVLYVDCFTLKMEGAQKIPVRNGQIKHTEVVYVKMLRRGRITN